MRFNFFKRSKKVAVITGATGGLGKDLVKRLLNEQYRVIMVARNMKQLEQISLQFGKEVTGCLCDISHNNEIAYLCHDIRSRFGQINVLIHSAGTINPGSLDTQTDQMITEQIQVNLTGAILITKGLLPLMKRNSSIIFINSLGGLLPLKHSALYSASKFGLRGFALALSLELRPKRIYVSSIFPGAIETQMLHREMKCGGSILNFCSPPLSTEIVCDTVIKAIRQRKLEYFLPKWSGLQIKPLMMLPGLIRFIMPILEKKGRKGQKTWKNQQISSISK
ncbi:Short-chain dehydrogenase (YqjQ) [Commensalibacter communis]|uniref:Short-chain dehydrogenase (YqjQ) n=1 Tax=Commensalibacter communis TaxID=2972786 RepID=A0A9W4TLC4_9PROT|nr:SDR family NAD(P)-dependent oxidoreductase [Commensalibacter communis]CAI3937219.1 Short-chain dehydrogenase (YqjQ) [Commensalibacter communis]CAI3943122.1 Short-chain dehydrogenase (YqjQ) [Commensalibacter communis]CAI3943547.1 Short-chain dehydrogenase (YqjQ) [Commensalibacter communis]CAI3943645.1 Short-chain dehydrogenase (YqjQ) [Commensalibacter communis]CAI3946232.1 Short-chain dehydrogenase (YqjQ) [Commensalibacter communis]